MPKENTVALSAPPAETGPSDLSAEIVRTLEKEPGDRLTCRHVSANHYRCNWWASTDGANADKRGMAGLLVTTHTVRKSQFLNVTKAGGRLVIKEVASPPRLGRFG